MLKSRLLAIGLTLVMVAGLILAGATGVMAANTFTIYESSSGGQIFVAEGDTVEIVLTRHGGTPYIWFLIGNSDPAVINNTGHQIIPTNIPGGTVTDIWTFSALKAGLSTMNLELASGNDIARSFNYTVHVYDPLPGAPATSTWLIGLMIGGLAVIMAFAIIRKTSRV